MSANQHSATTEQHEPVDPGLSSTLPGANLITEDVQEAKLELVAEVAAAVW
jgi:hypothetical protein